MDAVSVIVTWGPQVSFKARDSAFSPKLLAKWATDSPAVRRTGSMQSNSKGYFHAQKFTHPQSINVVFNINQDTHHTETELAQSAIALLYCLYDFITILFPSFNSQCERWTRIWWF